MQDSGLKTFEVTLTSPIATSFRCTKAANSLDIDQTQKSVHHFKVDADVESDFNVGVIVGASGSGKTTLAQRIYGADCFRNLLDLDRPLIDQLPESMGYDECAAVIAGVGLTSVPCWIRPAYTLSNGQRARAECALQIAHSDVEHTTVIDEWTSVVDRTVAKVMSFCIQKHARRAQRRIVLLTCHYDVIEWLNPDWIIDCNKQEYVDRRLLRRNFQRGERLRFDIRETDRSTWRYFSKYHYLSDRLPRGEVVCFGMFHGDDQIGFNCFANYVPFRTGEKFKQMHSNRSVVHPDYAGFGLGTKMINETCAIMVKRGCDVRGLFSSGASGPMYKALSKQLCWIFDNKKRPHKVVRGATMQRYSGFRIDVSVYPLRFSLAGFEKMKQMEREENARRHDSVSDNPAG